MANTIITPDLIGKEAAYQAVNNMVLGSKVDRRYEKDYKNKDTGGTVNYRMPNRFLAKSGATLDTDDVKELSKPITISERWHTSMEYPSQDLTLSMRDFSERYITPAMIPLANKIDEFVANLAKGFHMAVGTPGTTPSTFEHFAAPSKMLSHMGVPKDGNRHLVLDPDASLKAQVLLAGLQNSKAQEPALRKGLIGHLAGFDVDESQNIVNHTAGALTGTPLVNGASQDGSTLAVDGFTGTVSVGTVFTMAGVYMVNPISKQSTGVLQQFTVTAARDGAGDMSISPEIIGPASTDAARQNVDALPADNAAITFLDSGKLNMAFHKNAIGLVTVPLAMPDSAGFKSRYEYKGVSIRMVKGYNISTDVETMRFDVLFGGSLLYPEYGTRLYG